MKLLKIASRTLRVIFWVVLGIVLFVVGVVGLLYTESMQTRIKDAFVARLNQEPGVEMRLDTLRLRFPLDLHMAGLSYVVNGDTMIAANTLDAKVKLRPLIDGKVDLDDALLTDAKYRIGNADSAMQMRIDGRRLAINTAHVKLSTMDIDIVDGEFTDGVVSLDSRIDTVPTETPTDTTTMRIRVERLALNNFVYKMRMEGTIDSLGVTIGHGVLTDGVIDMQAQTIDVGSLTGSLLDAAYIAPTEAEIEATLPLLEADTITSPPWTVRVGQITFDHSHGLYTTSGYKPLPGLDFEYIEASDMTIDVKDFYSQATTIRLPIELTGTERCGVQLHAFGTFAMDSVNMYIDSMTVETPYTNLWADGMMGVGDMTTDPHLPVALTARGNLGIPDLRLMFPDFVPYLKAFADNTQADLDLTVNGTPGRLNIPSGKLTINNVARLTAKGYLTNIFDPDHLGADITLGGNIMHVMGILRSMLEPGSTLAVPPMSLDGHVVIKDGNIQGNLAAMAHSGRIALDGKLNSNNESYTVSLKTNDFPVNAFLTDLDIPSATVDVKANGAGFDLFSPKTTLNASANIASLVFGDYDYRNIALTAAIADGQGKIDAVSSDPSLELDFTAQGNLTGKTYDWTFSLDGNHIDLEGLKMSETEAVMTATLTGEASMTDDGRDIEASLHLDELDYHTEIADYEIRDVKAHFLTNDSLTSVTLVNRDLTAQAQTPSSLDTLMARLDATMAVIDHQMTHHVVSVDSIQRALPKFEITANAGSNNLINDILSADKMSIRHMSLSASNDSTLGLNANVLSLRTETMRLDTISVNIDQEGDKMHMAAAVNNRPGTLDDFAHAYLDGVFNNNKLALRFAQQNIKEETGFDIGVIAALADSTVSGRIFPLTPVIGYKKWTVNLDNNISYNFPHKIIKANLKMRGDDSSLDLYTKNTTEMSADSTLVNVNNIFLNISDVHLADWITFNPFAPPIEGTLSADMNLKWDGGTDINGDGKVLLSNLYYDRQRVGDFQADIDVNTTLGGMIRAKADLMVDGERTMTLAGALNDDTKDSPFDLDFSVIHFPLQTVNPFLPADLAQLQGTLNGEMVVSGDSDNPIINGEISFDDAAIRAPITNTTYAISGVKIPVKDNLITFDSLSISGTNENPLYIDGTVDVASMVNPRIDLSLTAKNMMLVNSTRAARGAEIYGKAYIDLDTRVKGNMDFMNVKADLKVLTGTNVTYVLTDAAQAIAAPTETDMVKFVNFNDSLEVVKADSLLQQSMLLNIDASLTVQNGTTINVDLPSSSRDKVQILSQGTINYQQTPVSDGRVIGRLNINGGFARYTLPVVGSEKEFTFDEGSYVAFNGDMLNPVLNLHATDVVRANVTQEGQNSRLVNFDILLGVTGTLERMDVKFDLATNDDITIANELQSMTPEQRANQAMNLLLYNMYTGPGTKASANLTVNPLFSFLESQINNWTANNIKGVDLQFGIDQYNQTTDGTTSQTMSYSYRLSKTLFNDRFKIVIGGNYTTDADADENLSENLINDISFEYFLNKNQTMLLKIFRHTGFESILEGEITQTGVGFVYKRKMQRLSQMLPKFMRPRLKD